MSGTVLVTGGAGYIGSHACKALAAAGYRPVAYDNLVAGHREAVRWGPLEEGDIADRVRLDGVLARYRPAAVMHFAAFAYVGESMIAPDRYYRNNLGGTLGLLEAVRAAGVARFVLSSTCAVYGVPERLPIREEDAKAPINPYGRSKLMVEGVLEDYCRAFGMGATALRYFNAAGADPDGEIGEDHDPETHLVPLVLAAATPGGAPVTVFGTDYPTADGTCIRDYTHVTDLADAHVAALRRLETTDGFAAFNLGTGKGLSVREIITAVEAATGRRVGWHPGPRRPGDPAVLVADPTLAARELGWRAHRSTVESMVGSAWAWMERKGAAA